MFNKNKFFVDEYNAPYFLNSRGEKKVLVRETEYREFLGYTHNVLNLILKHLELRYVPATTQTQPAKLEKNQQNSVEKLMDQWVIPELESVLKKGCIGQFQGFDIYKPGEPLLKAKRKYTKRKKTAKK